MVANGNMLIGFTALNLRKIYTVNAKNFYLLPNKVIWFAHNLWHSMTVMSLSTRLDFTTINNKVISSDICTHIWLYFHPSLHLCLFCKLQAWEHISGCWKYDILLKWYVDSLEDMKFQLTFSCVLGEKQLGSGNEIINY